jgi:hypothetical protein
MTCWMAVAQSSVSAHEASAGNKPAVHARAACQQVQCMQGTTQGTVCTATAICDNIIVMHKTHFANQGLGNGLQVCCKSGSNSPTQVSFHSMCCEACREHQHTWRCWQVVPLQSLQGAPPPSLRLNHQPDLQASSTMSAV